MLNSNLPKKRHLFKTITWRLVGTIDTILLGFIVSGQFTLAFQIGGLELFTKTILYYLHERAWYRSKFGVKK